MCRRSFTVLRSIAVCLSYITLWERVHYWAQKSLLARTLLQFCKFEFTSGPWFCPSVLEPPPPRIASPVSSGRITSLSFKLSSAALYKRPLYILLDKDRHQCRVIFYHCLQPNMSRHWSGMTGHGMDGRSNNSPYFSRATGDGRSNDRWKIQFGNPMSVSRNATTLGIAGMTFRSIHLCSWLSKVPPICVH